MAIEKSSSIDLLSVRILEGSLCAQISLWVVGVVLLVAVTLIYLYRVYPHSRLMQKGFEIDRAEFGIGGGKVYLRPNITDRQVAYEIWVELSTRKIGLPIDFENDVIHEIYDSWYSFFSITRNHVKTIPVNKLHHETTREIVDLSIAVLNEGLRPHLTKWQARFRWWYEGGLKEKGESGNDPQELQKQFPRYEELIADMEKINQRLIKYRQTMYNLAMGERGNHRS